MRSLRRRSALVFGGLAGALGIALGACGSDGSGAGPGAGNDAGADGTVGSGGAAGDPGFADVHAPETGSVDDDGGCASQHDLAKRTPVDLFFMIDKSLSMDDEVQPGSPKWRALSDALAGFMAAPGSEGLGVGVDFFPQYQGAPSTCTQSTQCGGKGKCEVKWCRYPTRFQGYCDNDGDCNAMADGRCLPVSWCENNHEYRCDPDYLACDRDYGLDPFTGQPRSAGGAGTDSQGFPLGKCVPSTAGSCERSIVSCDPQDYQTPTVPIAPLPGVAAKVSAALIGEEPSGNTPSSPALEGAIAAAKAFAARPENAGHSVNVVFFTDGVPTNCLAAGNPEDIQAKTKARLAEIAADGRQAGVRTYAIGVFAAGDVADGTDVLSAIASSGGTVTPFIVDATAQATSQFLGALNAIRAANTTCTFALPVPTSGVPDYAKTNVEYKSAGGAATLAYVGDPAHCDPTRGGWYYDQNPFVDAGAGAGGDASMSPTDASVDDGAVDPGLNDGAVDDGGTDSSVDRDAASVAPDAGTVGDAGASPGAIPFGQPSSITLCPAACAALGDPSSRIDVVQGCVATATQPPPALPH